MTDKQKAVIYNIIYSARNKNQIYTEFQYDNSLDKQIDYYIEKLVELGVTNLDAQTMCINIYDIGGYEDLKKILNRTMTPYTLNNIFSTLKSAQFYNSASILVGERKHWNRHANVYKWIKEKITNQKEE